MKNARSFSKGQAFLHHQVQYVQLLRKLKPNGAIHPTHMKAEVAFVGVGRIAPDEERLVLLKLIVHFSFTYGVLRDLLYN